MAFFRGEEGSVSFEKDGGTNAAITSTRSWSLTVNKELLEVTDHGDTSRAYVGGLISGEGTVEVLYTASSSDETNDFISDIFTTEDGGDATFELFLDTSGTKKLSFAGIITSAEYSATVGELEVITCNFTVNGAITEAL